MKRIAKGALAALMLAGTALAVATPAAARVSVGIGLGFGPGYYGPGPYGPPPAAYCDPYSRWYNPYSFSGVYPASDGSTRAISLPSVWNPNCCPSSFLRLRVNRPAAISNTIETAT